MALLERGIAIGRVGDTVGSTALLERAYELAMHREDAPSAATALANLSQQARFANDLPASLRYAQSIFDLTGPNNGPVAFKGYLALGHHFASMGCDADVVALMLEAESRLTGAALFDLCEYFELRGTAEARVGNTVDSVRAFDTLLDLSARHDPLDHRIVRLASAAHNATSQGLMGRAFTLHERALSLAKTETSAFGWSTATLSYAWNALIAGNLTRCRSLVEAAELWPHGNLHVRVLRAATGVLLGCLVDEWDLVVRCLDVGVLELVLAESSAYRAGPVAAAVHEYYTSTGDENGAATLRARVMSRITKPHGCWWLLLQVAVHGNSEDTNRAAAVLAPYENFALARAHRLAIDGRLAWLGGHRSARIALASEAAAIFSDLGWRYHHAICLQLAERAPEARRAFRAMGIRKGEEAAHRQIKREGKSPRHYLSATERKVAMLVAKGATNNQIAQRLGMPQRTIKYHLTFIFNRFGVHRRAEIAELVNRDPSVLDL